MQPKFPVFGAACCGNETEASQVDLPTNRSLLSTTPHVSVSVFRFYFQ